MAFEEGELDVVCEEEVLVWIGHVASLLGGWNYVQETEKGDEGALTEFIIFSSNERSILDLNPGHNRGSKNIISQNLYAWVFVSSPASEGCFPHQAGSEPPASAVSESGGILFRMRRIIIPRAVEMGKICCRNEFISLILALSKYTNPNINFQ